MQTVTVFDRFTTYGDSKKRKGTVVDENTSMQRLREENIILKERHQVTVDQLRICVANGQREQRLAQCNATIAIQLDERTRLQDNLLHLNNTNTEPTATTGPALDATVIVHVVEKALDVYDKRQIALREQIVEETKNNATSSVENILIHGENTNVLLALVNPADVHNKIVNERLRAGKYGKFTEALVHWQNVSTAWVNYTAIKEFASKELEKLVIKHMTWAAANIVQISFPEHAWKFAASIKNRAKKLIATKGTLILLENAFEELFHGNYSFMPKPTNATNATATAIQTHAAIVSMVGLWTLYRDHRDIVNTMFQPGGLHAVAPIIHLGLEQWGNRLAGYNQWITNL